MPCPSGQRWPLRSEGNRQKRRARRASGHLRTCKQGLCDRGLGDSCFSHPGCDCRYRNFTGSDAAASVRWPLRVADYDRRFGLSPTPEHDYVVMSVPHPQREGCAERHAVHTPRRQRRAQCHQVSCCTSTSQAAFTHAATDTREVIPFRWRSSPPRSPSSRW